MANRMKDKVVLVTGGASGIGREACRLLAEEGAWVFAAAYQASKGAVRQFTKACAVDLAPFNIRVNSIHPGLI